MPGKLDHREALRPRGWAGSAGGDAGATNGEQEKEREEGRKGRRGDGNVQDTQPQRWGWTLSAL